MTSSPEIALDDMLDELQRSGMSPLEVRVLLWLAETDATPTELASELAEPADAVGRAVRRLDMRGLVRRRFEGGREPRFLLGITTGGLRTLKPFVWRVSGTGAARLR